MKNYIKNLDKIVDFFSFLSKLSIIIVLLYLLGCYFFDGVSISFFVQTIKITSLFGIIIYGLFVLIPMVLFIIWGIVFNLVVFSIVLYRKNKYLLLLLYIFVLLIVVHFIK